MDFDANQYIDLFFQDTEEHLDILNDALLELESNPENKEAISELFRVAHTLKSSSAMVGFDHISAYTHKLEDCLSKIRDGEVSPEPGIIDSLFKCFDILKAMLGNLQSGETEAKKNELKKAANQSLDDLSRQVTGEVEAPAPKKQGGGRAPVVELGEADRVKIQDYRLAGEKIYEVIVHLDPGTRMGSVRAYLVCTNLRQIGDVVRVCPDVENDENAEVGETFTLILATHVDGDEILAKTNVDEVKEAKVRDVTDTDMYDVVQTPEEKKPESAAAGAAEGQAGKDEKPETPAGATTAFDRREDRTATRTVRVNIEKLDLLLNLAGELVINRGRAMQQASSLAEMTHHSLESEDMIESIQEQGRLINQLQEAVMDTRMVPIGQVFSRFRRVVRDLSKEKGKKINLDIKGEETELDKKIIDQIGDPLTHMVRNAIDHGIEDPDERRKAGKQPEGTLRFDAYHEGNNIHVKVSDDGRGIDVERIREKALEKGLASAEALEQMSDRDVLQLIFQPGFSTAKQVTDISGRGVGMDVVKRSIDELGGHVEINTQLGKGTVFIIKLPLTLAIIQALLVDVGGEIFAIPIANVKETIRITRKEIFSVEGRAEVIRLRDDVVPLLRLDEILETPATTENERLYVAVIGYEDKQVGLIVNRMVNEQEVVVKALEGEVKKVDCIAGASIMGDGSVSLILDGVALIDYGLKRQNGGTKTSVKQEKVGA